MKCQHLECNKKAVVKQCGSWRCEDHKLNLLKDSQWKTEISEDNVTRSTLTYTARVVISRTKEGSEDDFQWLKSIAPNYLAEAVQAALDDALNNGQVRMVER